MGRAARILRMCLLVAPLFVSVLIAHPTAEGASPEHEALASILGARIDSLRWQGRYDQALEFARQLLVFHQRDQRSKPYQVADAERLIALLKRVAALPPTAMENLAEVDRLETHIRALMAQAKHSEAISASERQLRIRRRYLGGEHPLVAASLNVLAEALYERGDYAAAEPLWREVLAIRRRALGSEHPDIAESLSNLGALLHAISDDAGAEPLLRESLEVLRRLHGSENLDVAKAVNNLAYVMHAQGDPEAAEALYREALGLLQSILGAEHLDVTPVMNNIAMLFRDRKDYTEAEKLFRRILAIQRKHMGHDHPVVAMSLAHLGLVLKMKGDYASAEPLYREALAIQRKARDENRPHVAAGLRNLGLLLGARGDYSRAESLLAEAASFFEGARLRAAFGFEWAGFRSSAHGPLALARLSLGRGEDAWEACERGQAQTLAEILLRAGARRLTAAEETREYSLRLALGDLQRSLQTLHEVAERDTTGEIVRRTEETRTRLLAKEAEWGAFRHEMATKYPVVEGQAFGRARVQAALRPDEAILGWLDSSWGRGTNPTEQAWGYVIRSAGPVHWEKLPLDGSERAGGRADDRSWGSRYRKSVSQGKLARLKDVSYQGFGDELFQERLASLLRHLTGVTTLIVIPSGRMAGAPVEALSLEDGQLVGDRFAVSYSPSATIRTWLLERKRARTTDGAPTLVLVVGDPPFNEIHLAGGQAEPHDLAQKWDEASSYLLEPVHIRGAIRGNREALRSLPRLSWSRAEIEAIASYPGARVTRLAGPMASEQELVRLATSDQLRRFHMIHLATHAFPDDERPEESSLILSQVDLPDPLEAVLAGQRVYDGRLTAGEILREWQLEADLVTLSGCETALGKDVPGEGHLGLAHAFLQVGARSLLVTHWQVPDRSTALLMQRFYWNLLGGTSGRIGMSKVRALQEAKQWLRNYRDESGNRPYEHPYYWAAFVLMGDPG